MQYLNLALYAEGRTDYSFFIPLLRRLTEEICTRHALRPVEVSDVMGLDHPTQSNESPRHQRIADAARQAMGTWRILFIHADGAGDPDRARREQVDPGREKVEQTAGAAHAGVGVVPVRETEAWAIADGDALRAVFGTTLSDELLGLPTRRDVETDPEPKKTLAGAFKAVKPPSRLLRKGTSPYLGQLGEEISLDCLRQLESFRQLERDLMDALARLNFLR